MFIPEHNVKFKDLLCKNWDQSVQLGELWMIYLGLKMVNPKVNVRIFTDNKGAQQQAKDVGPKTKYKAIVSAIKELISIRTHMGTITQIHHVYSHLKDGKKPEDKVAIQMEKMKQLYHEETEYIVEGNQVADELANSVSSTPIVCFKPYGNQKIHLILDGKPIYRSQLVEELTLAWKKRQKTYTEKPIATIDNTMTHRWFYTISRKNLDRVNWCVRHNVGKTPTRQRMHQKYVENKVHQEWYSSDKCPFHEDQTETDDHVISCEHTIRRSKALPRKIIQIINRCITTQNRKSTEADCCQLIQWFPIFYSPNPPQKPGSPESWAELLRQPYQNIWKGLIPNHLRKAIEDIGLKGESATRTLMQVVDEITKQMKKRWKERCAALTIAVQSANEEI